MTTPVNNVSQPPLTTQMVDDKGIINQVWLYWFRDLYRRTAYKGANAIDQNKAELDGEIVSTNTLLNSTIVKVDTNTQDLIDHEVETGAHGSNGVIVGFNDVADEATYGLVKRMITLSDAVASTASVVVADASAAPAVYTQSHSQELVDLSNANKAAINSLVTDLNNAIIVLNNLILESKNTGQMT